jgi:hypothetical protein
MDHLGLYHALDELPPANTQIGFNKCGYDK